MAKAGGRPRTIYWNNIPTPYVVGRFNAIAARGNLDFEAWFDQRRNPDRSWDVRESDWRFPGRYIADSRFGAMSARLPIAELRAARPDVLISLYSSSSFALGSMAARAAGCRLIYRVLPTYDAWVRRSPIKEAMKHLLFRNADGVKTPGPDGAAVARRYGVPDDRIFSVTQSIDLDHYRTALAISAETRRRDRERRGLHGCVFLYVGRLWSGKGLDYLIEAYARVRRATPDVSLLVVGDGVDDRRYRSLAASLPGVHFEGFVQPDNLPSIYALADALVFPTLGDPHGLVVEEAMAAGLPVICTEAAGDIRRRLPEGEAGYIVRPADASHLADRMTSMARDTGLRSHFGRAGQAIVAAASHERYAIDLENCIEAVMSMPRRRTLAGGLAHVAGASLVRASSPRPPAPVATGLR